MRCFVLAGLLLLVLGCVQQGEAQPIGPTPTDTPLSEVVDEPMCKRLMLSSLEYREGRTSKADFHQIVKEMWLQINKENPTGDEEEDWYIRKGLDVIYGEGAEEADTGTLSLVMACAKQRRSPGN